MPSGRQLLVPRIMKGNHLLAVYEDVFLHAYLFLQKTLCNTALAMHLCVLPILAAD